MSHQISLKTKRLLLRPFDISDASTVQRLAGVREVSDMTQAIPYPYEDGMAEEWIATHASAWINLTNVTFAICEEITGDLIGCVGLTISKSHNRATLGYWLGMDFWGQGYCTEASKAVLAFAFDTLKLNRVDAIHLSSNPASGAVMEKIGMLNEGVHRQYVRNNGVYCDVVEYGILAGDQRA